MAVDSCGSFVDAAEECKVSQPALSMQIRKLENTLGVSLFDRSRRPNRPTEIGQRVIVQACLVLREAGCVQELIDIEGVVVTRFVSDLEFWSVLFPCLTQQIYDAVRNK